MQKQSPQAVFNSENSSVTSDKKIDYSTPKLTVLGQASQLTNWVENGPTCDAKYPSDTQPDGTPCS